jgi:hypothetical protein
MSAFPPLHTLPSKPISTDLALKKLGEYLSATQSHPYLLPNATLHPDGPKAASDSGSNLVIHNLKRVQAGLRGEWLAPSLDLDPESSVGLGIPIAGAGRNGKRSTTSVRGEGMEENDEGWQDLDEYQREQSIEGGEIGDQQMGMSQEGDEGIHPTLEVSRVEISEEMRKKARREAKKARRKEEKKNRVNKK